MSHASKEQVHVLHEVHVPFAFCCVFAVEDITTIPRLGSLIPAGVVRATNMHIPGGEEHFGLKKYSLNGVCYVSCKSYKS